MNANGLLYGSFNPLHLSHVELMEEGLRHFERLHIFARHNEGVDLVDWKTKEGWLLTLRERFEGRLSIYKLELSFRDKQYDRLDFKQEFLDAEKKTGVRLDGLICGEDMRYMADEMKKALPDRVFYVIPRDERSSSRVREDLSAMKGDLPDFVYLDLKEKGL